MTLQKSARVTRDQEKRKQESILSITEVLFINEILSYVYVTVKVDNPVNMQNY